MKLLLTDVQQRFVKVLKICFDVDVVYIFYFELHLTDALVDDL